MIDNHKTAPIFITGTWRCGSTLISRMLNNHVDLDVSYDTNHFMRFSFNRYNKINNIKNATMLVRDTRDRIMKRYGFKLDLDHILNDLGGRVITYALIYDAIMRNYYLLRSHKKIWGEKTNLAWTKIPSFLEMFPHGRVIHIIRDPRAVLLSWKKFTHAPGNDYLDSILNCYDSMQKAQEYIKCYPDKRYVLIRYEDLVTEPVKTLKNICNKFEIDYCKDMLNVSMYKDLYGKPWQANTVHTDNINGISTSVIDKWENGLEKWEICLTNTIMNDLLIKFNYKYSEIINDDGYIDRVIKEIQKSELTSDGFIRFLLTNKGHERYPSDPLNEDRLSTNKVDNNKNTSCN